MAHDARQQHSSPTVTNAATNPWTEPPWTGWIETTGDALLILEAARRGLIPRVTRRLVDSERRMITSGSVFVFDEDESGIKRWTDGFFWSPSRILGNFLLYRETEKRGAGHRSARAEAAAAAAESGEQQVQFADSKEAQTLSRPKGESKMGVDRARERSLVGSLTNSYKFKPGGMMKKTFSLTIGGVAQHLISYYKVEDVEQGRLRPPSALPDLASLEISPEYLDKTHFRNPPKVEIGVDGIPRYRGEGDDSDSSPHILASPLTPAMPLYPSPDTESQSKRGKRYDPYGSTAGGGSTSKRSARKRGSASEVDAQAAAASPQTGYAEGSPTSAAPMHAYPPYGYYQIPPPGYAVQPMYPQAPYSAMPPPASSPSPPVPHSPTPPAHAPAPSGAVAYPPYAVDSHGQYGHAPYYPAPPHGYAAYPPPWAHYGYAAATSSPTQETVQEGDGDDAA